MAGEAFDVLVVDTFPRGLGGELVDLLDATTRPKVLVHRALNPRYVAAKNVAAAVDTYDVLLVVGEPAPFADHPRAVRTAPWLIRDAGELLPREEARARLGASDGPVVAVPATGRLEEGTTFAAIAAHLERTLDAHVVLVSPVARPDLPEARVMWPFFELIRGVDVLVGAAGYNTVHEARATNTPLVAHPMPRRYDQQARRVAPHETAFDLRAIESAVAARLARPSARRETFDNGARDAVHCLTGASDDMVTSSNVGRRSTSGAAETPIG